MSKRTSYNEKMQVKRLKLNTQDDVGGIVQTKITVFTAPCRIRQIEGQERSLGGKDGIIDTHRVYCSDADIRNKDELIISKRIYDVTTVDRGSFKKGSMEVNVRYRG